MILRVKYLLIYCLIGASLMASGQTANFSVSGNASACDEHFAEFKDASVGASTWLWDFGDNGTAYFDAANPPPDIVKHIYASPGTYEVSLTVDGGDVFIITSAITVYQSPTASLSADANSTCYGQGVQFNDLSTDGDGTINKWDWVFFDGQNASTQNPLQVYDVISSGGTYDAKLTVEDDNGCKNSIQETNVVTVYPLPTASIGGMAPQFVPSNSFSYNGSPSSGTGLTYEWDFGDPSSGASNTSTLETPTHTFSTPGNYTSQLLVTDVNGCADSILTIVRLYELKPDFNSDIVDGCKPLTVNFFDQSTTTNPPMTYEWDFGDPGSGVDSISTQKNPTHVFNDAGTYTVTFRVKTNLSSYGGDSTIIKTAYVTVYDLPTAGFTTDTLMSCGGFDVTYTDTTGGTTAWSWDVSNELWTDTGSAYARSYDFSNDYIVPTFTHSYTFPKRYWADSNKYDSDTIINVSLIATDGNGCMDTIIKDNHIEIKKPLADFRIDSLILEGCAPLKIHFKDSSTYTPLFQDSIVTWIWYFGDGDTIIGGDSLIPAGAYNCRTTCTYRNPTHFYTDTGTFVPTLIVVTAKGCVDTVSLDQTLECLGKPGNCSIMVGIKPESDFSLASDSIGCHPFEASFFNHSSDFATEAYWDFGVEGRYPPTCPLVAFTFDTLDLVSFTYEEIDTFDVRLYSVFNGCVGDTFTYKERITVNGVKPLFNVKPSSFCTGDTLPTGGWQVTIIDSTQGADYWLWNLGDSVASTFESADTVLTVLYDSTHLPADTTFIPQISPSFKAGADTILCSTLYTGIPSPVLIDTIVRPDTTILPEPDPETSIPFTLLGDYIDSLQMTSKTVVITPDTSVQIYKDTLIDIADIGMFSNYTIYEAGDIYNDTTYTIYLKQDTFILSKDTSLSYGCATTISQTGDTLFVIDTVTTSVGIDTLLYSFDSISISLIPTVIPDSVVAVVPDYMLPVQVDTMVLGIGVPPDTLPGCEDTTFFEIDTGMCNELLAIDRYIVDILDTIFIDTLRVKEFKHTYTTPGDHEIKLYAWNSISGCLDSTSTIIFISQLDAGFTGGDIEACGAPYTAIFSDTTLSIYNITKWEWHFGDGDVLITTSAGTGLAPKHEYLNAGNYQVRLIATDAHGCMDTSSTQIVRVHPNPTIGFAPDTIRGCVNDIVNDNLTVTFTDTTTNLGRIVNHTWDFDDGVVASSGAKATITHQYSTIDTFYVGLTLIDEYGCTNNGIDSIPIVTTKPTASFSMPTTGCGNTLLNFNSTPTGAAPFINIWDWCDASGTTTTSNSATSHTYNIVGDSIFKIMLTIRDFNGCYDTISKPLEINKPVVGFTSSLGIDSCTGTFNFSDTSKSSVNDPIKSYAWNFDGFTGITLPNATYSFDKGKTVDVTLSVVTNAGCTNETTKSVYVPGVTGSASSIESGQCSPSTVWFSLGSDTVNIDEACWDFGDGVGICNNGDTVTHIYTQAGRFTPQVILYDTIGHCDITLVLPEVIIAGPSISISTVDSISCSSASFDVNAVIDPGTPPAPPPYTYEWDFGDSLSTDNQDNGVTSSLSFSKSHYYAFPGSFDVALKVTDDNGCVSADTVSNFITILSSPAGAAEITYPYEGCVPFTVEFTIDTTGINPSENSIVAFNWDFDGDSVVDATSPASSMTYEHTFSNTGSYIVKADLVYKDISTSEICQVQIPTSQPVIVNSLPTANFSSEPEINGQNIYIPFYSYYNESEGAVLYEWNFDDPSSGSEDTSSLEHPTHRFNNEGVYDVELVAINEFECRDTVVNPDSIMVKLSFQNIFTPNGDEINDYFRIVKYGQLHAPLKLLVFNRWGQLKYKSEDYQDDWDGKDTDGNMLNEDTYYYILNYADKVTWTGWVFLMRGPKSN